MRLGVAMGRARGGRVERGEDAVGIFPVEPHVPIEMRREYVRFVDGRVGVVDHRVIGNAMERRSFGVSGLPPGILEDEILDRNQFESAAGLGLVDQDRRLAKVGVCPEPVTRGDGGAVMPSRSGRK